MNLLDFETDVNGNNISYDGNPNLKRLRVQLGYTKEHVSEYLKCSQDWLYFAEKYYFILDIDIGMIHPQIRDYQKEIINSYIDNKFTICLAARQTGKSTSFEIFVVWTILFNKDKTIAILANKAEQSRDLLRKIKQAYEMLPKWLQQGVKIWNAGSIRIENGSMVLASSTSSTAIRGRSISCVIVDERGHIPGNIWDGFIASVYPTISSGKNSKVIYVGTPNGLNHFYKDWIDSIDGKNKFNPIRVDWWLDPKKAANPNFKEETIANIGQTRWNQEFGLSFQGSIATLIDPEYVKDLKFKTAILSDFQIDKKHLKYLNIYETPIKGHIYSIGVDSAKMTEDNAGDALGMQVIDITNFPFKQVATFYAKNGISYLQAPKIACDLGNYYNKAYMFVENNEIGQEVANMIHFDYEYENTYFEKGSLPGYRTTKKSKRIGCSNLKLLIENHKIILHDFETISQLSTFIRVKDTYKAETSYQDDLVMSLIAGLYVLISKGLDITSYDSASQLSARILDEDMEDGEAEPFSVGFFPTDEFEDGDNDGFGKW
jgi:hypothetical protein